MLKFGKVILFEIGISLITLASSHWGFASPPDLRKFYCSNIPQPVGLPPRQASHPAHPNFYVPIVPNGLAFYSNSAAKDCGGAAPKKVGAAGLCIEMAKCVYITPEVDAASQELHQRPFQSLTVAQKTNLIFQHFSEDSMDAILTCRPNLIESETHPGRFAVQCPMPDACKGDVMHNLQIAPIRPDKVQESFLSPKVFQPTKSSPGN
jgi:hypothetical protein